MILEFNSCFRSQQNPGQSEWKGHCGTCRHGVLREGKASTWRPALPLVPNANPGESRTDSEIFPECGASFDRTIEGVSGKVLKLWR